MPSKVWVIGSAVTDNVYRVNRLPQPGESVFALATAQFLGGKGSNQAIAAARAHPAVGIIACVGQDSLGDRFIQTYHSEGLDTRFTRSDPSAPTGSASITIQSNGLNQIVVDIGANNHLTAQDVNQATILEDDFVLCQFEVQDEVVIAASQRGNFILNPAPYRPFPTQVLQNCFAITPNETEIQTLTGIDPKTPEDSIQAAKNLISQGPRNVILTLGERGALWLTHNHHHFFPAPKVESVDTTAAGDVFNGFLIAALAQSWPLDQSIPFAISAASLSVTKHGAIPSIPSLSEVKETLKAQKIQGPWDHQS